MTGAGTPDPPLVSVVTPSLDQAQFLEETIRSVREQDYPALEHVVVDGGSTDRTLEILARHPHVRWVSEPDRGQADALAKGFRLASGSIFGWLNADDVYRPGAVSAAVDTLLRTGAALAYGGYDVLREDGAVAFTIDPAPWDYATLLDAKNFVPQPSAFFTRAAYEAVGGVDPQYHYAMDYDLWVRIGARFPAAVVDGILSGFRFQPSSKSTTSEERFYPEARRISRRNGGRFLSRMFLHHLPYRHPLLFRAVVVARVVRTRDARALASLVRR